MRGRREEEEERQNGGRREPEFEAEEERQNERQNERQKGGNACEVLHKWTCHPAAAAEFVHQ